MLSFKLGDAVCNLAHLRVGTLTLTPQEADLLRLFVNRAQEPIERMEFYREIWGYRSKPQGRALDFAVRRLRQRLEKEGAPSGVIETVRGVGFRLAVAPVEMQTEPIASSADSPPTSHLKEFSRTRLGTVFPRDGFVGREAQLAALRDSLQKGSFTTLVGPPGVGKSRLAMEVLRETVPSTLVLKGQGRVTLEDLLGCFQEALQQASADSPRDVAIGLKSAGIDHVLIENADKLDPTACEGLDSLHAHGKDLTLLVTRRGPLHVGAERVVAVAPLAIREAAELFCERARRLGISIEPSDEVRELVAQLDGLPLAIELAATRARVLSLPDLKKSLEQRFKLLRKRSRSPGDRHGSLEVVLTEAFSGLSSSEKAALLRLSHCKTRFSEELAQALLADLDELHIDLLEGLVDHGLL
ncbi:MAG: winged helix-turn-helix domain-containing protein, partial [Myxococcota bacterium]|nr:winged helix-turn-helix domain-containing protein [Myxococcota bacterium]